MGASPVSKLRKEFGVFLKEKRERAGISQREVAKKLGYGSPQFVSNWERGLSGIPLPKLKVLIQLYHISTIEVTDKLISLQRRVLVSQLGGRRSSR